MWTIVVGVLLIFDTASAADYSFQKQPCILEVEVNAFIPGRLGNTISGQAGNWFSIISPKLLPVTPGFWGNTDNRGSGGGTSKLAVTVKVDVCKAGSFKKGDVAIPLPGFSKLATGLTIGPKAVILNRRGRLTASTTGVNAAKTAYTFSAAAENGGMPPGIANPDIDLSGTVSVVENAAKTPAGNTQGTIQIRTLVDDFPDFEALINGANVAYRPTGYTNALLGITAGLPGAATNAMNSKVFSWECPCMGGGWEADPFFVGFDKSKFEFHGVAGERYVIFGKKGGDLAVAEMRASSKWSSYAVVKTYFDRFGIQIGGGTDRVGLSLTKEDNVTSWRVLVEVNEQPVYADMKLSTASLTFVDSSHVLLTTSDTVFDIQGRFLYSENGRHLNLDVRLEKEPSKDDWYLGVLGETLNRHLGNPTYDASSKDSEGVMRRMHATTSLFPMFHMNRI